MLRKYLVYLFKIVNSLSSYCSFDKHSNRNYRDVYLLASQLQLKSKLGYFIEHH